MERRRWVLLLSIGLLTVFGGGLLLWIHYVKPVLTHHNWSVRVDNGIKSLVHKRPPDVTKGQWEHVVGWTINLHSNCGMLHESVDPGWRDGFLIEFERRLAGPLTLADIDWLWDEYALHTRGGARYADLYRPTRVPDFREMPERTFGIRVD